MYGARWSHCLTFLTPAQNKWPSGIQAQMQESQIGLLYARYTIRPSKLDSLFPRLLKLCCFNFHCCALMPSYLQLKALFL